MKYKTLYLTATLLTATACQSDHPDIARHESTMEDFVAPSLAAAQADALRQKGLLQKEAFRAPLTGHDTLTMTPEAMFIQLDLATPKDELQAHLDAIAPGTSKPRYTFFIGPESQLIDAAEVLVDSPLADESLVTKQALFAKISQAAQPAQTLVMSASLESDASAVARQSHILHDLGWRTQFLKVAPGSTHPKETLIELARHTLCEKHEHAADESPLVKRCDMCDASASARQPRTCEMLTVHLLSNKTFAASLRTVSMGIDGCLTGMELTPSKKLDARDEVVRDAGACQASSELAPWLDQIAGAHTLCEDVRASPSAGVSMPELLDALAQITAHTPARRIALSGLLSPLNTPQCK